MPDFTDARTGRDGHRHPAGGRADGLWRPLEKDVPAVDSFEGILGLPAYKLMKLFRFQGSFVLLPQLAEAILIVEREVVFHVLVFGKSQSFFFRDTLESLHMNGIVIGKNAVEIKDDGSNHEETLGYHDRGVSGVSGTFR